MNIYATILSWIIVLSLCPLILALSDRLTLPFYLSKKNSIVGYIYTVGVQVVTLLIVLSIHRITEFAVVGITNDFAKVIIYIIILAFIANEKLYYPFEKFKDVQHGMLWGFNKLIFTFLPLKTLLYVASTICLVASQLQALHLYEFSEFWSEFFSYHEYALLIVFSVNEITDHLPVDLSRIKLLMSNLSEGDVRGFDPVAYGLKEEDDSVDVHISCAEKDRKIGKSIANGLEAQGIVCRDSANYHYDGSIEKYIERVGKCSVFVVIISDEAMQDHTVVHEIIAAYKLHAERSLPLVVYKITDNPYTDFVETFLEEVTDENCFLSVPSKKVPVKTDSLIAHIKNLIIKAMQ